MIWPSHSKSLIVVFCPSIVGSDYCTATVWLDKGTSSSVCCRVYLCLQVGMVPSCPAVVDCRCHHLCCVKWELCVVFLARTRGVRQRENLYMEILMCWRNPQSYFRNSGSNFKRRGELCCEFLFLFSYICHETSIIVGAILLWREWA